LGLFGWVVAVKKVVLGCELSKKLLFVNWKKLKTHWWKPLKDAKSRSTDAFNFPLWESWLLEKVVFWIRPFGLAFGYYRIKAKAKAKSQTKHTLELVNVVRETVGLSKEC
jgi:hypothetical protein